MKTKSWYKSKGVIGSLLTMVTGILVSVGLFEQVSGAEIESAADNVLGLIVAVEGLVAFIGRVVAKTSIEKKPKPQQWVPLFLLLPLLFIGCNKVNMDTAYRRQVEMSAMVTGQLNQRCQDGDDQACKDGLDESSRTLKLLVDAMNGVESETAD